MLLDIKQFLVLPVLELIEALSCKNVTSEYLPHTSTAQRKHAALGFDEYRVLTITVAGCQFYWQRQAHWWTRFSA